MVEYTEEELNLTFSALSNPTRRNLMERLARGEATISDLARPYDMSFAAVSKHLQVLEAAGLIQRRVEGREHHLSVKPGQLAAAVDWLTHFMAFWEDSFEALEKLIDQDSADA